MRNKRNKTDVLSISIPRDLKAHVIKYAQSRDLAVSQVVREATRTYIIQKEMEHIRDAFAPAFEKLGIKTDEDVEKYFG